MAKLTHGTIVVGGTGRVAVEPDVADLQLGVSIARPTVDAARAEAATTMNAILAAIRIAGVADRDIRTTLVSVQPRYDYRDGRAPILTGYDLSNQVRVTVRDLAGLGRVIDGSLQAGATSMDSLSFRLDDPTDAERAARLAGGGAGTHACRDPRRGGRRRHRGGRRHRRRRRTGARATRSPRLRA